MEKVLGKFAPSYKGDYVPGTYQMFDVVFDGESSFISLVDNNVTALADDGVHWRYLCRGNSLRVEEIDGEVSELETDLSQLSSKIGYAQSLTQELEKRETWWFKSFTILIPANTDAIITLNADGVIPSDISVYTDTNFTYAGYLGRITNSIHMPINVAFEIHQIVLYWQPSEIIQTGNVTLNISFPDSIIGDISKIKEDISTIEAETDIIIDMFAFAPNQIITLTNDSDFSWVDGACLSAYSDSITALGGFKYNSILIPVVSGAKYNAGHKENNEYIYLYDVKQKYVQSLLPTITGPNTCEFIIPNDIFYIKYSYWTVYSGDLIYIGNEYINIAENELNKTINKLNLESLENGDDNLLKILSNPLERISRSSGYGSIIKNWGFIGDSLASGCMECFDQSDVRQFIDYYNFSWGQIFSKINGVDGYNFAQTGQTAKAWIEGVTERTWDDEGTHNGAKVNLKQGYMMSFGANDYGQYPVGSVSTDINTSDYTLNAATYVGYYAGIIQRIKSVQPKAKFFCITCLWFRPEHNLAVGEIVDFFSTVYPNDIYFVDLVSHMPESLSIDKYALNGHLSPMGYEYVAYCVNTYIDCIIRTNAEYFKGTALIGTQYKEQTS